jgi:hypothetical protein
MPSPKSAETAAMLQPKTRVHILSFVGASFEPCWKEKGIVCRPRRGAGIPSDEWSIVEFDAGGRLCVHRSRLMVANDQSAAA